jgi:hypothetical protein
MPIMAAHGRSDARGTARLLANMALASIDNPRRGEPQEVALNNMYRLLQSFRKDTFLAKRVRGSDRRTLPRSSRCDRQSKGTSERFGRLWSRRRG